MIELANVHKSFGKVEVLKGITASVEKIAATASGSCAFHAAKIARFASTICS